MTPLPDTHLLVLSAAAARDDRMVAKTKRLPCASLRGEGIEGVAELARGLTDRGISSPRARTVSTHTTVARLLARSSV
jgi:hypothetical protein